MNKNTAAFKINNRKIIVEQNKGYREKNKNILKKQG